MEQVLYLVTTLGVPLKIAGRGGQTGDEASVDSELTTLYEELHGKGLEIVSVNRGDTEEKVSDFVKQGGGLVVLGGAPFHQPVRQEAGRYVLGPRQPTFAHELFIADFEKLRAESGFHTSFAFRGDKPRGTVGCVALDAGGRHVVIETLNDTERRIAYEDSGG